jgi:hypothetical protein
VNALLDALGYVGDSLDKPGRAVRGLLAGNFREGLAALPFSDAMGITDQAEAVSGRGLLEQYGVLGANEDGLDAGDALGFGAELLLDPTNWFGAGAVKKLLGVAGKAAATEGRLAKLLAQDEAVRTGKQTGERLDDSSRLPDVLDRDLLAMEGFDRRVEAKHHADDFVEGLRDEASVPRLGYTPYSEPFYSRTREAIEGLPDTVKAEGALNKLLKAPGGVPKEELEYTKVAEAIPAKGVVKREDLLRQFDENRIDVQEVVKGAPRYRHEDAFIPNADVPKFAERVAWSDYQAPGGEDYKELLLTLGRKGDDAAEYQSPHWDEPDILAHVRFNTRKGPQGEKVLHVEEVQSDWHQAGKKHGYTKGEAQRTSPEDKLAQMAAEIDRAVAAGQTRNPAGWHADDLREHLYAMATAQARTGELGNWSRFGLDDARMADLAGHTGAVPDAPFKENWHELAMKRMVRWAAENGYDRVSWSPGQTVQGVVGGELKGQEKFYDEVLPGWAKKFGKKYGAEVEPVRVFPGSSLPMNKRELFPEDVLPVVEQGMGAARFNLTGLNSSLSNLRELARNPSAWEGADLRLKDAQEMYGQPLLSQLMGLIEAGGGKFPELAPTPGGSAPSFRVTPQMAQDALYRGLPLLSTLPPGMALSYLLGQQDDV